ncbi:MAG: inverse autotransporter beta domain-containing protein [Candidatus Adiutrix intracellularis]|jgi:hypothetical protein|nr:inverse autotransporter beta domain-containing protein [Candidatus Adiutrix intracellularis]
MSGLRLGVGIKLLMVAFFILLYQSRPGVVPLVSEQQFSSSVSDSMCGSVNSLNQTAEAVPTLSAGESEVDKEIVDSLNQTAEAVPTLNAGESEVGREIVDSVVRLLSAVPTLNTGESEAGREIVDSLSQTAEAVPTLNTGESEAGKKTAYSNKSAASPQASYLGESRGPFSEKMDLGSRRNNGTGASASAPVAAPVVSAKTSTLNRTFGLLGLPGLDRDSSKGKADKPSVHERVQTSHNYNAENHNRNPDGSYGRQSSRPVQLNPIDLSERLLQHALSVGSGAVLSWAEGWLSSYGNTRLNLNLNLDERITGSGDFLLPLYNTEDMTVFSQFGLRTMSGDRVIGNFGLGQRFFLSDDLALGYNGFLDYDFTRSHSRGGVGVEGWYDWLRLAVNQYTSLSGWKDSRDYDSIKVEEKAAEGWDARLTGYLPFYRNLAVKTAFEQWYGDNVGAFGQSNNLNIDPKVWSAGVEWTPVPLLSVGLDQRYSGGQSETQLGLTFNYHFDVPLEDQLRSEVVAEMRTVKGSRYEFVDRQYEMLLEYREKDEGIFNIIPLGSKGQNMFVFQITSDSGLVPIGRTVKVSLDQEGVSLSRGGVYTTDEGGYIVVVLTMVPTTATLPVMATLSVGKTTKVFPLDAYPSELDIDGETIPPHLVFTWTNGPSFVTGGPSGYQSTASVKVSFMNGHGKIEDIIGNVVWNVKSVVMDNPSAPWWKRRKKPNSKNGLTWGEIADGTSTWGQGEDDGTYPVEGTPSKTSEVKLTDVVGSRSVTLEVSVPLGAETYTAEKTIHFGDGPLSVFTKVETKLRAWAPDNVSSGGPPEKQVPGTFQYKYTNATFPTRFPAVATCGGTTHNDVTTTSNWDEASFIPSNPNPSIGGWTKPYRPQGQTRSFRYSVGSNLPTTDQVLAVSVYSNKRNSEVQRKGAAFAANWDWQWYWTGEVAVGNDKDFGAVGITLADGETNWYMLFNEIMTVCISP